MSKSPVNSQTLLSPVVEKYEDRKKNKGPLQFEETVDLIIELTSRHPTTAIVIDALDKCDIKTRHKLLIALTSISQRATSPAKVFVSSRDEKDTTPRLKDVPNLYIKAEHDAEDICCYVELEGAASH